MNDAKAFVELTFCPSLELIPVVRRFVSAFYEQILSHADAASRLALATHELLENTVKYSVDGVSSIHLGALPEGGATHISIRTTNRASERDLRNVRAVLDELAACEDAFEYYQEVMRRNARRVDGSGLGLARICAEAEMSLEHEIVGDALNLIARATVPGEPRRGSTLPAVSGASFSATSHFDGRTLLLRCTGNADCAAKDALEDLLPRVHIEAMRVAAGEVVVDFTALEFMNSSCFRSFVSWISDVQDLPPARQYHIRLLSNASMLWQRRSLHALKCFADDLVHISAADA